MSLPQLFTCRRLRGEKRWLIVMLIAVLINGIGGPGSAPLRAQSAGDPAAVGFALDAGDLRFIFRQIQIAQAHAAGNPLFGPGPNQVNDPRFPFGLRTVDGSFNHLAPGQEKFGASDQLFTRMTAAQFNAAENGTTYRQNSGTVQDSQPRIISNLIADQTDRNPAAVAVAFEQDPGVVADPLGTLPIHNVAPDEGLSAPFNSMFTFFGQFFDHGLDLVNKGGNGIVFVPLQEDDPLFVPGGTTNFMVLTRATHTVVPGPDGILGNADDVLEANNQTTPFVDQNQTYTSHPSHQVFLREYAMVAGRPVTTGRFIDGGGLLNGIPVRNIGNWGEVKAQAAVRLGIRLTDRDVFNIPLLLTDPYGRFVPGANGFPQYVTSLVPLVTSPAAPTADGLGTPIPLNAIRINHAFLDDIAHNAVPTSSTGAALTPDGDGVPNDIFQPRPAGTYDDELLARHFVTGDGRGNENIALTAVHTVFHAEHNRLADEIHFLINGPDGVPGGPIGVLTNAEATAWATTDGPSGWNYGERLFQAARFVTEMQYQHLVFEEFARKLVPNIDPFVGDGINMQVNTNPAIAAEFAHQTYRLGHSMLNETIARTDAAGVPFDIPLLNGFLNPVEFNQGRLAGQRLTAAQAAGAIFQGGTRQSGMAIDEFVTEAVRNRLLGLPLDLAVLNIARGRSEGVAPLNEVRRQLYLRSGDPQMQPYLDWTDFGFAIKHQESLPNFIAAYGIHPSLNGLTSVEDKRNAALALLEDPDFMFAPAATSGVNRIDLWMGGLAEQIAPFGGMLGSTFTYVFEHQLEDLQNADRFYYLERLDGLNLLAQMEGNSFAELIARNTALEGEGGDVFGRPDFVLNVANLRDASGNPQDDPTTPEDEMELFASGELVIQPNGTFRYSGGAHVIWNGTGGVDRIISSIGDDTVRGGSGNDRIETGAGNDLPIGGDGDDVLTDTFGDDVMKGGRGNDAIAGGLGPFDLLQGNEDHDFIVGGSDASEVFGGSGNDVIYTGFGLTESFGGAGDDWIESGNSPANVIVGDENNQFQNDPNGGHDVLTAGKADDDFDMEGGDDIAVGTVIGTHRFEGMLGFDWTTYRGEIYPVDADMLVTGATEINAPLNENRDRYDLLEGLSGTSFNDLLRGDDRDAVELADDGLTGVPNGHVLNAAGIARISGLAAILPPGTTSWGQGNIILGGAGSDLIEGRGGNDIIDGDRWLNVQLEGTLRDPAGAVTEVKLVSTLHDLKTDVFADPQRLNPGDIRIVRSIVTTGVSPDDVDTAAFAGPQANYSIVLNANGTLTVTDNVGTDGSDTLWNIELLQFADGIITPPTADGQVAVPNVVGAQQLDAEATLTALGFLVSSEIVESAAPAGQVLTQNPPSPTRVTPGSTVFLTISHGVELAPAPSLVGDPRAAAIAEITGAGFILGTVTTANSNTIEPGHVISQNPAAGQPAALEGPIDIVVSVGRPGLVLSMNFDEANGAPLDASVSGRAGTIRGATRVAGKVGSALSFDGVDDWVTVVDGITGSNIDLTNGMTLEAWVRPGTMNGWETVVMKERGGVNSNAQSYALYAADGAGAPPSGVIRVGTADRTLRGTAVLTPGAWTHIATTYDGINQRFFVNGVEVSSRAQAGNMAVGNQPIRIGGNQAFTGEFYNGLIDNVRVYNRALTAAELSAEITAAGGVAPPPPPPPPPAPGAGPVLSLNFDEASGNAIDSANGLVGTVSGAVRVPGLRGNALSFDGVNDSVTIPDAASLDLTTGMTLAAWVNTGARDGWETIILKENVDTYSYALYAQDGAPVQGGSVEPSGNVSVAGRTETLLATGAISGGTWVHIATTYDGTTLRFFVNGVEASNAAVTGPIDTGGGALRIGGNDVWAGEYYQGLIDEVRVYNRALTAAEIETMRNNP